MKSLLVSIMILFAIGMSNSHAGAIPGVEGPYINFLNGQILVSMALTQVELDAGIQLPIPKTVKSSAAVEPNVLDGGTLVTVKIDVEDIKKALNVGSGDPQTLPDGRAIPGIPGGELKNAIRIDLPEDKYNLSFYFSKPLFGIYVPFNFELPIAQSASIALKWKDKNIGALAVVGKDGDKRAAGTIFLRIAAFTSNKEMMDRLEASKRNPGKMY